MEDSLDFRYQILSYKDLRFGLTWREQTKINLFQKGNKTW